MEKERFFELKANDQRRIKLEELRVKVENQEYVGAHATSEALVEL